MTETKNDAEIFITPKKYRSVMYFQPDILSFLTNVPANRLDVSTMFEEFVSMHNYDRGDNDDEAMLVRWFNNAFDKHRRGVLARHVNQFLDSRKQYAYDSKEFLQSFMDRNCLALGCTVEDVRHLIDSLRKVQECKCPSLVRAISEFDLADHLHFEVPFVELNEKKECVGKTATMWELLNREFAQVPDVIADNGMWWYYNIRKGVKLNVNVEYGSLGFHYYYIVDVDYDSDPDLANVSCQGDCGHAWDIALGESSLFTHSTFKSRQWVVEQVRIEVQEKIDQHKQFLEKKKQADQSRAEADAKTHAIIDAIVAKGDSKEVSEFADLARMTCLANNEWTMSLSSNTIRSWTRATMTSVLQKLNDCPIVVAKFPSLSESLNLMTKIERDRQRYDQMEGTDIAEIGNVIDQLAVFVMQHLTSLVQ